MSLYDELEAIDSMELAETFGNFRLKTKLLGPEVIFADFKDRFPHLAECIGILMIAGEEAGMTQESVAVYLGGIMLLAEHAENLEA